MQQLLWFAFYTLCHYMSYKKRNNTKTTSVVCASIKLKQSEIRSVILYTVSQKRDLYTFAHNFGRCWRIFEMFPLLNSSRNLQQTECHNGHHTLNVLLHYLVKWQLSQTAMFISKQCIQHQQWQTKCHTVSLWWSSSASYKDCSKCLPFTRTQARSRERHWSISSSMTLCSRLSHVYARCSREQSFCRRMLRSASVTLYSRSIGRVWRLNAAIDR